jgi:hypothetical protein
MNGKILALHLHNNLAICLILFTIGFKLGFVQQSLTWKIIVGICAGFGVSAVINLKKSFN